MQQPISPKLHVVAIIQLCMALLLLHVCIESIKEKEKRLAGLRTIFGINFRNSPG